MWQWHYDFATHHNDDGVPEPEALNLHVFLDDVNEFNGPLHFIRSSHRAGPAPAHHDTTTTSYPLWVVERDAVARLVERGGLFSATGPAGTGLIFGDCLVHGSPANFSPWDRTIFSLILNPVANAYRKTDRPDYKHQRDLTPVIPLADDCLLDAAGLKTLPAADDAGPQLSRVRSSMASESRRMSCASLPNVWATISV